MNLNTYLDIFYAGFDDCKNGGVKYNNSKQYNCYIIGVTDTANGYYTDVVYMSASDIKHILNTYGFGIVIKSLFEGLLYWQIVFL